MASDNKTLYFNSNGHPGFGDADIFVCTRLDDSWTKWSEPINLGTSINSSEWDGYITIPASGEYAYFVSLKNAIGEEDIFKIKLFPSIKPQVMALYDFQFKDNFTNEIIQPKITFEKLNTQASDSTRYVPFTLDEEENKYKSILTAGNEYSIKANLPNYVDFSEKIDLTKEKKYREINVVYNMMPLVKGQRILLRNLFFNQSESVIKEESYPELNKIKQILIDRPTIEILLEGHTDNQGDMMLNIKLAEDRVNAVKKYLTLDGQIEPRRITIKSWGSFKPISSNSSEEERKKNRRVEFTILKM